MKRMIYSKKILKRLTLSTLGIEKGESDGA
jgi:hypothetical protein